MLAPGGPFGYHPPPPPALIALADRSRAVSPERVDAVDHPRHVLFVIDVCGLWEEDLEEKADSCCTPGRTAQGLRNEASELA